METRSSPSRAKASSTRYDPTEVCSVARRSSRHQAISRRPTGSPASRACTATLGRKREAGRGKRDRNLLFWSETLKHHAESNRNEARRPTILRNLVITGFNECREPAQRNPSARPNVEAK